MKIAALAFGVVLSHFIFVQLAYALIYPNIPVLSFFKIEFISVLSFAISLGVTWLMSLNRLTRKMVI